MKLNERSSRGRLPAKFSSKESEIFRKDIRSWLCSVCKSKLSTKESLRRHILTQHIRQKVYQCEACDKSFVLSADLAQHTKEHHSPDSVLPCLCGRQFTKRNSLLSHIRHFHHPAPDVRPSCAVCHKVFNDAATVRVHEARVHGEKTVVCDYAGCGKLFATVGLRNAHYRYHEGREYECEVCGKTFSTASYRDKHRLAHAGVVLHACDDCGARCITASQLGAHRKRHHAGP